MIKFYFLLNLMFVDTALFFCVIIGSDFLYRLFPPLFVVLLKVLMSLSEHVHIKITVKKSEIFHCLCPEGVE